MLMCSWVYASVLVAICSGRRNLLMYNFLRSGLRVMDAHSFDTQLNLTIDFAGTLERISIIIFRLSGSFQMESESSPLLIMLSLELRRSGEKRRGQGRGLLRYMSVKYGLPIMDCHSFDTQRNLTTDLAGNLERISIIIFRLSGSFQMESESESSPPLIMLSLELRRWCVCWWFQAWINTRGHRLLWSMVL
ncbi:unnamed protein product [Microthlaspi erraticum]|uniref:Uncharacterized protein n=1 Tax=Microthlaspi erraticum TaxID=1685480 RepID=A0A6D2K841_9BRAS|nr:unnamed protein product [Microthlaspi erraticum]